MSGGLERPDGDEPVAVPASDAADRGLAPVGVVLLVAIATVLAGSVATMAFGATEALSADPTQTAAIGATAEGERVILTHRGGDRLDVDELDIRVAVDGEPLEHQPPVPFFSATGFRPGPTGPFNAASDDDWVAGESAAFTVAGTNDPTIATGRTVEVEVVVDGRPVASAETVAEPG